METVDIIFLVIAIALVVVSTVRGLIGMLMAPVRIVAAFMIAANFGTLLTPWLTGYIPVFDGWLANILSYVLVFVIAFLLLWIIAAIIGRAINSIPVLGTVNKFLGLLLGLFLAFVLLSLVAGILKAIPGMEDTYAASVIVKFLGESTILQSCGCMSCG